MFDWRLFQDDELIEEYLSLKIMDDVYKVNDDLYYDPNKKVLIRNSDDYSFVIDIDNSNLQLKLNNYEGNSKLLKSKIEDNHDEIMILYQISEEEPIFKVVISRRQL